ncbi:hypothetical protein J2W22_000025 [Sphingomonas kyeonggiensis]|nr:hypothetical protein [Sphingomonas kyeonggiensis]
MLDKIEFGLAKLLPQMEIRAQAIAGALDRLSLEASR